MLVDLRSDTVTKPSAAMRRAMADAEVGDDWYGDDPTVNRLQERAAELTGTEDAVYVATGTMANEIAVHVLSHPGHLVVCEATAHLVVVEAATAAMLSGVAFRGVPATRGQLTAELIAAAIVPDPYGIRIVDLVALENTHQVGGGTVLPVDEARAIRKVAAEAGLPVYLDGARIFNASAASGTPVADWVAEADAVMFALSKGLGAPIGSVLCGTSAFIEEARRMKVLFGGAWRQAGVMAAAGLVALEQGPGRLGEDHARARRLAETFEEITPGAVDLEGVETNMVFVDASAAGLTPVEARDRLRDADILASIVAGKLRFVTHLDVDDAGIERAIQAWREVATR